MSNKSLLTALAMVLVGILAVMVLDRSENPFEAAVDSADESFEQLHDTADDLTTN